MPKKILSADYFWVYTCASLSSLLALALAWKYPGGMNPDGLSYLDLAKSWADGRFVDAINGYWSILLPLLMAPLQLFEANHTLTFSVVGAFICFFLVVQAYVLGQKLEIQRIPLAILVVFLSIRASVWATEVWTPDLLFASFGILATILALNLREDSQLRCWLLFGVGCGVLYLVKPVGLLTGVATGCLVWTIWLSVHYRSNLRRAVQCLVSLILGWAAIVVPTVTVLSLKYGYLTTGSSGTYNLALTDWQGWTSPPHSRLFSPPFEGATSAGTDPTFMNVSLPYSVFSMRGINLITSNLGDNTQSLWNTQKWWIAIVCLGLIGLFVVARRGEKLTMSFSIVLGIALIQAIVYLPVLFETRYLILTKLLLAFYIVALAGVIFRGIRIRLPVTVFAAIAVAFLLFPGTLDTLTSRQNPLSPTTRLLERRYETAQNNEYIHQKLNLSSQDCSRLASFSTEGTTYQSTVQILAMKNSWFASSNIQSSWSGAEMVEQIRIHGVDCVVRWNNAEMPEELSSILTRIADTGDGWIILYRVNP